MIINYEKLSQAICSGIKKAHFEMDLEEVNTEIEELEALRQAKLELQTEKNNG